MNLLRIAFAGLLFTSAGAMAQDCTAPDVPTMPNGAEATMEQMLEGQKAVKAFQEANLEYMGCLDPQIAAAAAAATAEGASDADKDALMALEGAYNEAVSSEEELAGQFNTEIRAYKEANPG